MSDSGFVECLTSWGQWEGVNVVNGTLVYFPPCPWLSCALWQVSSPLWVSSSLFTKWIVPTCSNCLQAFLWRPTGVPDGSKVLNRGEKALGKDLLLNQMRVWSAWWMNEWLKVLAGLPIGSPGNKWLPSGDLLEVFRVSSGLYPSLSLTIFHVLALELFCISFCVGLQDCFSKHSLMSVGRKALC